VSDFERNVGEVMFRLDCLKRDLRGRSFGRESEMRLLRYLERAHEAIQYAIAECANGSLTKEDSQ
jgi:hypothetical protein